MSRLILDAEEEAFVFENEWDTVIPISFTHTPEQGTVLTAFPQVEKVARAFLDRYENDPTSDEALHFLFEGLAPYMEKWGYHDDRFRDRWGYVLRADGVSAIPTPCVQVVPLVAADEEGNETTYDLEATCETGCLGYGVKVDGKLVSLAVTHESPEECETVVEVGVETIPAMRGKGFATACLAALAKDLITCGMTVEYRCQRYNEASRHVALAAGFRVTGRYYYYVGRRD